MGEIKNHRIMAKKVYNLIILDESGSMYSIERATVSGLNETIQSIGSAQGKHEDQQHFLSLLSFNSEHMTWHYDLAPVSGIGEFAGEKYCPSGCTPLYDAIGMGISKLRRQITEDDMVLVTIITDGLENSSSEFNFTAITRLMDSIKAKGWVITYIGANQDALEEAHKMHIDNGLSYDATPEGVKSMMKFERVKRAVLYDEIAKCASPAELRDVDYFGGGHKKKGKKS